MAVSFRRTDSLTLPQRNKKVCNLVLLNILIFAMNKVNEFIIVMHINAVHLHRISKHNGY